MGRKTKITKEMILEAAYELLDEAGIGAVAIKSIAQKLDCSTQPISWQFGSMTELKKELLKYAGGRLYAALPGKMEGHNALKAFFISGVYYITNACDHPKVFRFVNVDDPMETIGEEFRGEGTIFSEQFNKYAVEQLCAAYPIDPEKIVETVRNAVIYTHGLAVMMIWDHFRMPKKKACRMTFDMGVTLLKEIGIEDLGFKFEDAYNDICGIN